MGRSLTAATNARAESRAMVAIVAVFALLVQALIPATALAAPLAGPDVLICAPMGAKGGPAGNPSPGQPGSDHAHQHCLCPAAATPPPPVVEVAAVAYAAAAAVIVDAPRAVRPSARAPPRPPGQGPPLSNA